MKLSAVWFAVIAIIAAFVVIGLLCTCGQEECYHVPMSSWERYCRVPRSTQVVILLL